MLSMKDVDQESGRDLMPHRTTAAAATSSTSVETAAASASVVHPGLDVAALKRRQEEEEADNITHRQMHGAYGPASARGGPGQLGNSEGGGGVRRKQQLTEQELFEAQQLIRSGFCPLSSILRLTMIVEWAC